MAMAMAMAEPNYKMSPNNFKTNIHTALAVAQSLESMNPVFKSVLVTTSGY